MTQMIWSTDDSDYGQFCDLENYTYQYEKYVPPPSRHLRYLVQPRWEYYFIESHNLLYDDFTHTIYDYDYYKYVDTGRTTEKSQLIQPTKHPWYTESKQVFTLLRNIANIFLPLEC